MSLVSLFLFFILHMYTKVRLLVMSDYSGIAIGTRTTNKVQLSLRLRVRDFYNRSNVYYSLSIPIIVVFIPIPSY